MTYIVKLIPVSCPAESEDFAVCDTYEQAQKLIEKESANYSDKIVFEIEVV
jgi:hypothetical protein